MSLSTSPQRRLRVLFLALAATAGHDGAISTEDSEIAAYVIRVDEEQVIAQETARLLRGSSATRPA